MFNGLCYISNKKYDKVTFNVKSAIDYLLIYDIDFFFVSFLTTANIVIEVKQATSIIVCLSFVKQLLQKCHKS